MSNLKGFIVKNSDYVRSTTGSSHFMCRLGIPSVILLFLLIMLVPAILKRPEGAKNFEGKPARVFAGVDDIVVVNPLVDDTVNESCLKWGIVYIVHAISPDGAVIFCSCAGREEWSYEALASQGNGCHFQVIRSKSLGYSAFREKFRMQTGESVPG